MAAPQAPSSGKRNTTSQRPITATTLMVWANAGRTHRYPCGGGLYFQTKPTSASWVFRFRFGRARKAMGLGAFPEIGLLAAQERAGRARLALRQGRDPIAERAAARRPFVREVSDRGVHGDPRPMTIEEAVITYGDPSDKELWRNAKGDMKSINEDHLYLMLTRTLVRGELFRRGFPNAGRVRLGDIPPPLLAFPVDAGLAPLTVAKLKLYRRDYIGRGDTATALVLVRLAKSKAATKLWQQLQRRNRPPLGSDDEDEPEFTRTYVRQTILVDLYRDPGTRPDLMRLAAQISNESGEYTLEQVSAWLQSAADHESSERECIIADLLAQLAERATRPHDGTIAQIEKHGREFLNERRAADVLNEHGLPDQAAVHTREAIIHLCRANNLVKEWGPNASELIRAVRWGAVSWQITGLGNVGGIAANLVAAALNQPISRWVARRGNKSLSQKN